MCQTSQTSQTSQKSDWANLAPLILFVCLLALGACDTLPARIVVQWTTATEINTAGFNVYRSERAEGPFSKVNAQLIPASAAALIGGKYQYEDTTVIAGRTYYYQLEDVEFGGASARHGPIVVTASALFGVGDALMWFVLLVGALVLLGGLIVSARRRNAVAHKIRV